MDTNSELFLVGSMVLSIIAIVIAMGVLMAKFWYWLAWGGHCV